VAFGLGAAASPWVVAPPLWGAAAVLAGALSAWRRLALWSLPAAVLLAGLAWGNLRLPDAPIRGFAGTRAAQSGAFFAWVRGSVVDSEPWIDGCRCRLRLSALEEEGAWRPCNAQALAFLPVSPLPDGTPLEASLRLAVPAGKTNPGQFDAAAHLARQGIALTATARSAELVRTGPSPWWALASRYRRALEERLAQDAPRSRGILLALLLGERGLLPWETQDDLSRSGLFHMVALSGLHVGLLLLLLAWASHLLALHPRVRDLASMGLLLAYAFLVQSRPSLSRAILMALLFLLARLTARAQGARFAWSAAFALLLAVNPLWIFDAGFQLTFAATAGILLFWDAYPSGLPEEGVLGAVARLLWVGFSAQAATLPLLAVTFHRVSLLGWLATPLASLPLLGIQALGVPYLFGLAFMPGLHGLAGGALDLLGQAFLWLPGLLGRARLGSLFLPLPWLGWLLLYGGGLALLALPGRARRAGWVLLVFALVGAWSLPRPWGGGARKMTVLDVGQASAQVVQWGDRAALVDAGNGNFEGPTSARTVIEPFLAGEGIRGLGGIVLTHWDADHSGAVPELIRDLPVGFLAYPAADPPRGPMGREIVRLARNRGVRLAPLQRGERMALAGLPGLIRHPPADTSLPGENNRSLVLELQFAGAPVLFTGDLEREGERSLVEAGQVSAVYAVVVPHHGSATSSSPDWLKRLAPRIALVSAGRNNRFGHPSPAVLQRYFEGGTRVFRTDRDGAVALVWEGARPLVFPFLADAPPP
jgi:competence protein ComEC